MKLQPILIFSFLLAASLLEARTVLISKNINYLEEIEFQGAGSIILQQGSHSSVQLEGEEEIVHNTKLKVQNGILKINRQESALKQPSSSLICTITVANDLSKISLKGDAVLQSEKLTLESLHIDVHHHSSAIISLLGKQLLCQIYDKGGLNMSGEVKSQEVLVEDSGRYQAASLVSRDCKVKVVGSGEAEVQADDELSAYVVGQGRIYYLKEPKQITKRVSGTGQILMKERR